MTDKDNSRGHAVLLVDRSYSMRARKEEGEQGVNEFAKKQGALKKAKVTMSLYQFCAADQRGIDLKQPPVGYEKVWGPVKVYATASTAAADYFVGETSSVEMPESIPADD